MIKYKIYIVNTNEFTKVVEFIEVDFNYGCGYDSLEEANLKIKEYGDNYVHYTILPYMYLTN